MVRLGKAARFLAGSVIASLFCIAFLICGAARADLVTAPEASSGARNDGPYTIGYSFTVGASDYTVNALGVEDDNDNGDGGFGDGLKVHHVVAIWDANGTQLATADVPSGKRARFSNGFRYAKLNAPLTLSANTTYFIGTLLGGAGQDPFYGPSAAPNLYTRGSALGAILSSYSFNGTLDAPACLDHFGGGDWAGANATYIEDTPFIGDSDGNTVTATESGSGLYSPASKLLDGSGMINLTNGKVTKSSTIDPLIYWTSEWLHNNTGGDDAVFTFNQNTSLKEMVIWNASTYVAPGGYSYATQRAAKTVIITCSTGTDTSGDGTILWSGDLTQTNWPASGGAPFDDDIAFTEVANVKAVKIHITSNWDGDYTGLSEVRFMGTVVPDLPNYTVTYDANGGIGAPAAQTKTQGVALTLSSGGGMIQTGYAFTGWNTVDTGTGGVAYTASGTYTADADVTLYAQWTAVPTYTVTYNTNGGTGTTAAQTKTQGVDLTLSSGGGMAKTGYTFAGWNTVDTGTGGVAYTAGGSYTADSAVTLYAQWTAVPTYTVIYDANTADSGSVPTDSGTYLSGATVTVAIPWNLVKAGYTFAGWNTTALGGGTSYAPLATFNIAANTTLYAQWSINFIGDSDGNAITATASLIPIIGAPANLVDGSGMSPNGPVIKDSKNLGDGWAGQWITASPNSGSVKFTFTKNTALKEMLIWNLGDNETDGPHAYNRGLRAVKITYSIGTDDSGVDGTLYDGDLNECPHPMPSGGYSYQNDITLPEEVANVKAVQITWTSNWGDANYAGLSEVRFVGTPTAEVGAAAKLAFTTQPGGWVLGAGWATQPVVTVQDASGNTVDSSASITLEKTTGTPASGGPATLGGTTTVSAVHGVATFSGLSIGTVGVGYKLTATSAGLTSADSTAFDITAAVPTITATGSPLTDLTTAYGTASGAVSFTVSGANMTAGITVTPPLGFEVSTTSDFTAIVGNHSAPITVGAAGTIENTTVYVRLAATALVSGTYNGQNIELSSAGASQVNVVTAESGNAVSKATPLAALAVNNSPQPYTGSGQAATVIVSTSSVLGDVANVLTGGAAMQTSVGTYAVTANFVPTDSANYNTLLGLSVGNFTVTPNLASWINGFFGDETNPAIVGPNADPDHDGLTNEQEYAFGLNPTSGASCDPITVQLNKTTGKFTYTRRNPALTNISYSILTSTTLVDGIQTGDWAIDGTATQTPSGTGELQTVEVTLTSKLLEATKLFVRVKAIVPAQ
ncbi:MAG: InlB B-repeat-containing protein [Verrucomicrobiota bacterium]